MAFPIVQSTRTGTARTGTVSTSALVSLAVGDLMVAAVSVYSDTPTTITPPSGWATLHSYAVGNTAMCIFSKTAVLADLGATFAFNSTVTAVGVMTAAVSRITGQDPTTPILASSFVDGAGGGTAPAGTAINPALNVLFLQMIPYVIGSAQAPAVSGYLVPNNNPSWTENADVTDVTATNSRTAGVAVASANQGALGTTGAPSATISTASQFYLFGFIGVQGPVTFAPTGLFGATFGVFAPTIINIIVAFFGAVFGVFAPASSGEVTNKWSNLTKHIAAWTPKPKS